MKDSGQDQARDESANASNEAVDLVASSGAAGERVAADAPPQRGNYVAQGWLVLLFALVFGAGLAALEMGLRPKIEANRLRDTMHQAGPVLQYGARDEWLAALQSGEADVEPVDLDLENGSKRVYRVAWGDQQRGWVVPGKGLGFADAIGLIIGLDLSATTITGLDVLDQKETPGLGDAITGSAFTGQFAGKRSDTRITAPKSDPGTNDIAPLTGATISSVSVCRIVNTTLTPELRRALAAAAEAQP
jgi:Na+-translocating ferredoxin:NAD+ oxidoreductase subunit G